MINFEKFFSPKVTHSFSLYDVECLSASFLFYNLGESKPVRITKREERRIMSAINDGRKQISGKANAMTLIDIKLSETDWKAIGRLCLYEIKVGNHKWARTIVARIFADAIRRGNFG